MSTTSRTTSNKGKEKPIEIITSIRRKRRWSTEQKLDLIQKSEMPGHTMSSVAREYGISPSQLFTWRKLMQEGGKSSLDANDEVISLSEYRKLEQRIKDLERTLGKKTMENEILHEAIKIAREKKLISRMPLLPRDGFQ